METPRAVRVGNRVTASLLTIGVSLFVVWYFTRWTALLLVGLFYLYTAVPLSLIILAWVLREFLRSRHTLGIRPFLNVLGLLFASYPIAAACVFGAIYLMSESTLVVHNLSGVAIERIVVIDPQGNQQEVGALLEGKTLSAKFHPKGEGSVRIRVEGGGKASEGLAIGYVSGGVGSYARVAIHPDLRIEPQAEHDRI